MSPSKTASGEPKKPAKAKPLPKASNGAKPKSGPAGVVRTTRPPMPRPPASRGGR